MRPRTSLAIAFALLLGAAGGVAAEDRTVPPAVEEAGFAPAAIEAPAGARVRLEVTNRTAVAIEFESVELNRERVIQPGQTGALDVSGLGAARYALSDDFLPQRP